MICLKFNQKHLSGSFRTISFFKKSKTNEVETIVEKVPSHLFENKAVSKWEHLNEEEIMKIRDKSGLDDDLKCEEFGIYPHPKKFYQLDEYKRDFIKPLYAKYGRATGLRPGVCFPSHEELDFIKKFESTFYPPLNKLIEDMKAEKLAKEQEFIERERRLEEKLKLLPKLKEKFFQRLAEKHEAEEEEKRKQDKLIQEVREYVGYDIDPRDERFQEVLSKKEQEEKMRQKLAAKKDKGTKMAEMLSKLLGLEGEDAIKPQKIGLQPKRKKPSENA